MTPNLNWLEIQELVANLGPELQGLYVDRIVIPERRDWAEGFIKGEWALKLSSQKIEKTFIFSVRAKSAYISLILGKGPKASAQATHSAFDLALSKTIKGLKIKSIRALKKERVVELEFVKGSENLVLAIVLIPAAPEAILYNKKNFEVIARSRNLDNKKFTPPDGAKAPENPSVKNPEVYDFKKWHKKIEETLACEAFEQRKKRIEKILKDQERQAHQKLKQSEIALKSTIDEPNWSYYGELLKSVLHHPPAPDYDGSREIVDYASGEKFKIPGDPNLSAQEQVKKYFHLAKRSQTRAHESKSRLESAKETLHSIEKKQKKLETLEPLDFEGLQKIEKDSGLTAQTTEREMFQKAAWPGRMFVSKDGFMIWVGRNRVENMELTLKSAKGNDLWMHLKGRPGCHTVIPVPAGKSISLETLLDAAQLTVLMSGGQNWGKTEVDYTYRKHVKRIKGATEVSYTQEKTLVITPDPERLKRLMQKD